jgi:hypothetical protein
MDRQRHAAGSDAMKFWHWKIWQWRVWRWIERIAHSIGAMLAIVAIAWIVVFVSRPSEKSGNQPSFTGAEQQQKRLAIFLDGTWNSVDSNTNVWRMRALTGITEPALLRASHIVPWADCTDAQRLDVHNGLLLSALWDAAFDRGLISFADDGTPLASPELSETARKALGIATVPPLTELRDAHRTNLAFHRSRNGF